MANELSKKEKDYVDEKKTECEEKIKTFITKWKES